MAKTGASVLLLGKQFGHRGHVTPVSWQCAGAGPRVIVLGVGEGSCGGAAAQVTARASRPIWRLPTSTPMLALVSTPTQLLLVALPKRPRRLALLLVLAKSMRWSLPMGLLLVSALAPVPVLEVLMLLSATCLVLGSMGC